MECGHSEKREGPCRWIKQWAYCDIGGPPEEKGELPGVTGLDILG